ncbi:MAG: Undecaprenyl-phosphate mannosyltransferase [Syntrophomonadaceae bacterium]|nr:Undecaprenyl-phosphate mannosyltransferase [Bacillota bacterium]
MYKGQKIAVVVPAYNEERFIAQVLNTIPSFVDCIYAVNDGSIDHTLEIMQNIANQNGKVTVVNRETRGGVGAAIITGHKMALEDTIDVVAVMAGDGQMDPTVLDKILDPVIEGKADYSKGNRLSTPQHQRGMSTWRRFGNFLLNYLTKLSSGYWHISDPQNGYTAISREALERIDLDRLETGFAFENNMLVKLNIIGARVVDVPHPARYGKERSKIRYHHFILTTSWVLLKGYLWRLWAKYLKRHSRQDKQCLR